MYLFQKSNKDSHSERWRQITPNEELAHKLHLPCQLSSTSCGSPEQHMEQDSQALPSSAEKSLDFLLISDSSMGGTVAKGLSSTHF